MKSSPLLRIDVTEVSASQVALDEPFQMTVAIDNFAPCDMSCDSIWLTLTDAAADSRITNLKPKVVRQTSTSSLDNRLVMNLLNVKKQLPPSINLRSHFEGTPDEPVATGIACINPHELLRRNDSSSGVIKPVEEKIVKDIYSQRTSTSNVVLKPGKNIITLIFEVCVVLYCPYT